MDEGPQQRSHDDHDPRIAGRAVPAAKQKTAKERFFANRRHHDYCEPQPGQIARRARRAIDVELKLGDDTSAEQSADPIAHKDENDDDNDAYENVAFARQREAEIVGGAGARSPRHYCRQQDLDRGRYADDQGNGDAIGGEIQQPLGVEPVPPGERSQRHRLPDQQRDDTEAERGPASPMLHVAGHGRAFARPSSAVGSAPVIPERLRVMLYFYAKNLMSDSDVRSR